MAPVPDRHRTDLAEVLGLADKKGLHEQPMRIPNLRRKRRVLAQLPRTLEEEDVYQETHPAISSVYATKSSLISRLRCQFGNLSIVAVEVRNHFFQHGYRRVLTLFAGELANELAQKLKLRA